MERSKSEVFAPQSSAGGLGRKACSGSSLLPADGTNISSVANVSVNTSVNSSDPVSDNRATGNPRRKSRFGALARSLLSESTDSTLSPNSVRGIMNPFRSQLGLPPLEVSRLTTSPEMETDSSGSPPFKLPTPPTPTPTDNDTPPMPEEELSHTATPTAPDRIRDQPPKPEYTPKNQGKVLNYPLPHPPPPLYFTDQNVPPRSHPIAAIVPAHPVKANPIYRTPVASSKAFCPPPAAPPPSISKVQKVKKPNSGWRFQTENVQGKEYLIMNQIGKGGCGEVFLVMEKERRELFALKKVNLSGLDQRGIEECTNEIKLLVELKDTDLVIHIESWEMNPMDKTLKIVMELGQCDLNKSISSDKIHTLNQIKSIWERILLIVHSIHQKGIVHADLKPANFVWVGGNLKIIDFGIANKLQADYTSIATLHPKGTLNFISPETINQDAFGRTKISPKSDVWSLGCILHLMIFGRTPFQTITHQVAKINAILHGVPGYPPLPSQFQTSSVLSVLQLCFQVDPKQRPTASQLLSHPFLQDQSFQI